MESPADTTWRGYSLTERDRRWKAVRDNAARVGLDCILVPLCAERRDLHPSSANARGNRADSRYLTQMEDAVVVLPTDGKPPIVINDRGVGNEWIQQARPANREWARTTAEALLDAGMERGRIGVSGMKGGKVTHVRAYSGVVVHSTYTEVVQALPNATFEDATDVVGFARYVKSEEEIECLRRATAIAEEGIEEMIRVARPGVDEAVLYARVTARLMELGSENYHWALLTQAPGGKEFRSTEPPIGRRLQPGTLITNEVTGIWGGMVAQEDQPVLLGPIPKAWKPVIELQREVFEAGLQFMKPGMSFSELIDFINEFGRKRGMKTLILMHGRGMGNDGPLLTPRARGEKIRDVRIEKGSAFVWKPYAMSADEKIEFVWGGDVVVTDKGGEKLMERPHRMVSIT